MKNMNETIFDSIRPLPITIIGATSVGSNALVLMEQIKGVAAFITVMLGVPTAALVLAYWIIKVWREAKK